MSSRASAVLAAALALGAPTSTFAQSVGDEQYRDPFAGEEQQQETNNGNGESTPAPAPAPAPAPTTSAPTGTTTDEPIATVAGELPRTGGESGWVAAIAVLFLAAGAGLRRTART
jgi:hypothetical protein